VSESVPDTVPESVPGTVQEFRNARPDICPARALRQRAAAAPLCRLHAGLAAATNA